MMIWEIHEEKNEEKVKHAISQKVNYKHMNV